MIDSVVSLYQVLHQHAKDRPHEMAFAYLENGIDVSSQVTWKELDQQAQAFAAHLLAQGLKNGDRVLLLYPSGLKFLVAFMGCMYAGAVAVPSSIPYREHAVSRLIGIVTDAKVNIACTTKDVFERMGISSFLKKNRKFARIKVILHEEIDLENASQWHDPDIEAGTLCFLQYTSGSTSIPKGVMISHYNLLRTIEDIRAGLGFNESTVMVTWMPIFHDLGLIYGLLTPLYVGAKCYIMSPLTFLKRPLNWLMAITKYRGTHTAGPNFAYELCCRKIREEEKREIDLSTVDVFINAAEPIRLETVEKFWKSFKECGLSPYAQKGGYGLAEATVKVSAQRLDDKITYACLDSSELERNRIRLVSHDTPNHYDIVSVGKSEIGADIRIVNPETKQLCAPDEVGEIWVRSDSVAMGYWNRPEETKEAFHAYTDNGEGPYLRTGDLGFLLNGDLYITGRIKDMIIVQGRNFYPQDIELTVEKSHPAVRPGCGAAFAVRDDTSEHLYVVQEVREDSPPNGGWDEVIKAIRMAIAKNHGLRAHGVALIPPRTILKTTSGKIRRSATRQAYLDGKLRLVAHWRAPA
ncbi:MAG: fatty acyl-AMP ligase [Anaerolineae bacterium]|nr:MAG: fatty acyl-AMP ligase [Anaerolineae bacterium]